MARGVCGWPDERINGLVEGVKVGGVVDSHVGARISNRCVEVKEGRESQKKRDKAVPSSPEPSQDSPTLQIYLIVIN